MIKENSKVVRIYKAGYVVKEEDWKVFEEDEPTKMRVAYNMDEDYIGNTKFAHRLCYIRGIKPEKASPEHSVCSIGFCEKENKWYGWSHRAMFGFGIGSEVKKGDCAYTPATPKELYDSVIVPDEGGYAWQNKEDVEIIENGIRIKHEMSKPIWNSEKTEVVRFEPGEPQYQVIECGRGEWVAKTLDDAKQMAIDFASGVS